MVAPAVLPALAAAGRVAWPVARYGLRKIFSKPMVGAMIGYGLKGAVSAGGEESEAYEREAEVRQMLAQGLITAQEAQQAIVEAQAYRETPRPAISTIGGVPFGVNVGNILGVEDPIIRETLNFFDPVWFWGAPKVIGMAGRRIGAARAARKGVAPLARPPTGAPTPPPGWGPEPPRAPVPYEPPRPIPFEPPSAPVRGVAKPPAPVSAKPRKGMFTIERGPTGQYHPVHASGTVFGDVEGYATVEEALAAVKPGIIAAGGRRPTRKPKLTKKAIEEIPVVEKGKGDMHNAFIGLKGQGPKPKPIHVDDIKQTFIVKEGKRTADEVAAYIEGRGFKVEGWTRPAEVKVPPPPKVAKQKGIAEGPGEKIPKKPEGYEKLTAEEWAATLELPEAPKVVPLKAAPVTPKVTAEPFGPITKVAAIKEANAAGWFGKVGISKAVAARMKGTKIPAYSARPGEYLIKEIEQAKNSAANMAGIRGEKWTTLVKDATGKTDVSKLTASEVTEVKLAVTKAIKQRGVGKPPPPPKPPKAPAAAAPEPRPPREERIKEAVGAGVKVQRVTKARPGARMAVAKGWTKEEQIAAEAYAASRKITVEQAVTAEQASHARFKAVEKADADFIKGVTGATRGKGPPDMAARGAAGVTKEGQPEIWGTKDFGLKEQFQNRWRARTGTPGGERVTKILFEGMDKAAQMEARFVRRIDRIFKDGHASVGAKGWRARADFGEEVSIALENLSNPQVLSNLSKQSVSTAKKLHKTFDEMFDLGMRNGVFKVTDYKRDYFTHIIEQLGPGALPGRYGGLGKHRAGVPVPGFSRDTQHVMRLYVKSLARNIHLTGRGAAIERMERLAASIPEGTLPVMSRWYTKHAAIMRHKAEAYVIQKSTWDSTLGKLPFLKNVEYEHAMATLRSIQGWSKIMLNPGPIISNAFQTMNNLAEHGLKPYIYGFKMAASKAGRLRMKKIGINLMQNRADVQRGSMRSTWEHIKELGYSWFQNVETWNRTVGYYVGEYVGKARGLGAARTHRLAMDSMRGTHFIYDVIDLPAFMSSPAGRVIFQFKTFSANQMSMIGSWGYQAVKGVTPAIRNAHRAKLARLAGIMVAIGGPGVFIASEQIRKKLGEEHPASKVFDGIEKLSVSGITGIDLTRRVDVGYMLDPVEDVTGFKPARRVLGPTVSGIFNVAGGLKGVVTGDKKKAARILREIPAGATISRAVRAMEEVEEGGERTPAGTLKVRMGASEVVLRALGLQAMRIKKLKRAKRTQDIRLWDYRKKRQVWSDEIMAAYREGKEDAVETLRQEAAKNGFMFSPKQLQRLRKRALAEVGTLEKRGAS